MSGPKALRGLVVAAIAATIAFYPGIETKATDGRRVVIEIRDFEFVPEGEIVTPGDVVVWKNKDIVPHTATARDDSWDSGLIEAGGDWETVITDKMGQDYYCRYHPTMIATLRIKSD